MGRHRKYSREDTLKLFKNRKMFCLELDVTDYVRISELADQANTTMASFVRNMIKEGLTKHVKRAA